MNEILKKRIDERLKIVEEGAVAFFTDEDSAVAAQYLELVKMAFTVGAEYALKSQWISIDEALPEDNQYVVAMLHDKTIFVGKCIVWEGEALWYFETPYGLYSDIELYSGEVIAWMPIPEMEE